MIPGLVTLAAAASKPF